MTVGPIGDLGETSTAISQQAQFLAQQNETRTQEAQDLTDRAAQADSAQQAILDRQDERRAQLEAQQEAQLRADDNRAALEAFGIQQAQLQDQILADQALEASQEVSADQDAVQMQQGMDQSAVNAFLNENTTVSSIEEALGEFQQFEDATGMQMTEVSVTFSSGSEIDTQL
jgi:hypothetical protein